MDKRKLILIIICIIVVLAIATISVVFFINKTSLKEEDSTRVKAGITGDDVKLNFLDFTVYTSDGNPVNLYDYQGMPIILNFWTSTQECANQFEIYQKVYPEIEGKINCLFINLTDEETESQKFAERFVQNKQITLPIFFDTKQSAAKSYNVKQSPTSIFIDKDGNVINNKSEIVTEDMLRANIDILLGNF